MKITITGHRPPKIGGYNPNTRLRRAVRGALQETIYGLLTDLRGVRNQYVEDDLNTGMAQGVDQEAAIIALNFSMTVNAFIPGTPEMQSARWPQMAKTEYFTLLEEIEHKGGQIILIPNRGNYVDTLDRRNHAMIDALTLEDHLIGVWDGASGGTNNCLMYACRSWSHDDDRTGIDKLISKGMITIIDPTKL